jgi:hypothetical protein
MFLKRVVLAHAGFGLAIQVQHVLVQILMAGLGAVGTYFLSKPTTTLVEALSSWTTAKPLLLGALGVFLVTVAAQAQQSFFSGGTTPAAKKEPTPFPGDSGPIPPAAQRTYKPQRVWPTLMFAPLLACCVMACIPNAASQIQDGVALEQCVQKHWGEPFLQVVAECLPNEEQAVADVIADIIVFLQSSSDGGTPSATAYSDVKQVTDALPAARARQAAHK